MRQELIDYVNKQSRMHFIDMVKKYKPELYTWIMNEPLPNNTTFTERVYMIYHDIYSRPTYDNGKERSFINFNHGYYKFRPCSETPTFEQLLKVAEYVSTGNFSIKYPLLTKYVYENTPDFGDAKLSERIYCLINNISIRPTDRTYKNFKKGYNKANRETINNDLLEYSKKTGGNCTKHGQIVKLTLSNNNKNNSHLYNFSDDKIGIEFVICPILKIRMLNIKKKYIENVLLMTVNDFKTRFPDCKMSCTRHKNAISNGLKAIDTKTGLTKHALSVVKSENIKKIVGKDGLTSNQRKGKKVKQTHLNAIDENGLNGYQRLSKNRNDKWIEDGKVVGASELSTWQKYKGFCGYYTWQHKETVLDGKPSGKLGNPNVYQVDHKFSVLHGFQNKISPYIICNIGNLEALLATENLLKREKSSITIEELLKINGKTLEEANREFDLFCKIVEENVDDTTSIVHMRFEKIEPLSHLTTLFKS